MFDLMPLEQGFLKDALRDDDFGSRDGSDADRSERTYTDLMKLLAKYHAKPTYGRLMKFNIAMYLAFYEKPHERGESPYPADDIFATMKKRLDAKTVRLADDVVRHACVAGRAKRTFPFNQGQALLKLQIASPGVCQAMASDWLRRKRWNAIYVRQKRSFHEIETGKLMQKMVKLQGVAPHYSAKNMTKMETVLRTEFTSTHRMRGFKKLAKHTRSKEVELDRKITRGADDDGFDLMPVQFRVFLETKLVDFPRGISWEYHRVVHGALQGHAVALYQTERPAPWTFFDANYGEYEVVGDIVTFMREWYRLYKPYGTTPRLRGVVG
ncbi:MAG TPA: hypothetical protein VEA38_16925 [Terriglobales bacterium]|nr:hypothetical protein [Terriglobales bacterium]